MSEEFCWISVADDDGNDDLKAAYDALRREDGTVHNLYKAFSQFPAPMVSADTFYRDVMHSPGVPLPLWLAELLSVDVAIQNGCTYAETHHGANFLHLHPDRKTADAMYDALRDNRLDADVFGSKLGALLQFGRKITSAPRDLSREDIDAVREAGWNDAEISQAVQVSASFAYWTRMINAFGISIGDEKVGKYG